MTTDHSAPKVAEYATIAHYSGCVSVTGHQGDSIRWSRETYDRPDTFDWSDLPTDLPVIDCAAATFEATWQHIKGSTLFGAEHVAKARTCGIPVGTAGDYARGQYMLPGADHYRDEQLRDLARRTCTMTVPAIDGKRILVASVTGDTLDDALALANDLSGRITFAGELV